MLNTKWTDIDGRKGDYTGLRLTPAQIRTLDTIRENLPKYDFYGGPDRYEIKKFNLSQAEMDPEIVDLITSAGRRVPKPDVFVTIDTGMKNDDGTLASIYCRKYRHLKIGPRGGIESCTINQRTFRPVSLLAALNTEYWT